VITQTNLVGGFTFANTAITVNRMGYGAMQLAGSASVGTTARPGRRRIQASPQGSANTFAYSPEM
jgi:hypothetical protein